MFLAGPFMQLPFMVVGEQSIVVTEPDLMLNDADADIVYFAEIEPWILADRS